MLHDAVKRYGQAGEEDDADHAMELPPIAQDVYNQEEDHHIEEDSIRALHAVVRSPEAESRGDGGDGGEDVDHYQN